MKLILSLFLILNFSLLLACKCDGSPTLKTSFQNADFVFIGEIYDYVEVPNGFKTHQNVLSKVKIEKVFKSDSDDEFYTKDATIFGSPIHSCDVLFTKKGKFLIFAYYETDTGLLYSDQCFVQKEFDLLTKTELAELEDLSSEFKQKIQTENSKKSEPELIILDQNMPNREINNLKKDLLNEKANNSILKWGIYILSFVIFLLIAFLIKKKNRRKH